MEASIATEPTPTAAVANGGAAERNVGRIEEIQGVVIEAVFPDRLPEINHAITIARPAAGARRRRPASAPEPGRSVLVCEVQQHLGDDRVRAVAMDTTDGLARGVGGDRHRRARSRSRSARRRSGASSTCSASRSTSARICPRTSSAAGSTRTRRASRT